MKQLQTLMIAALMMHAPLYVNAETPGHAHKHALGLGINTISWKCGLDKGAAFRTGLKLDMEDGFYAGLSYQFNAGIEGRSYLNKNRTFVFFYGLDAVISGIKFEEVMLFSGIGPVLGVQFYFNDRLSLSSELGGAAGIYPLDEDDDDFYIINSRMFDLLLQWHF